MRRKPRNHIVTSAAIALWKLRLAHAAPLSPASPPQTGAPSAAPVAAGQ